MATILLTLRADELRQATAELLLQLGYEVVTASSDEEAVRLVADRGPDTIDLLIADAYPPQGTEHGLVERLRDAVAPTLPALLLSGYGEDDVLRARVAAGEVAVLQLPFSARQLQRSIQAGLTHSPPPRPQPIPARQPVGRRPLAGRWPLAAAAALVAALGLWTTWPRAAPPALPAAPRSATLRSAFVTPLFPIGEQAAWPTRFEWRTGVAATSYRLSLRRVTEAEPVELVTRETTVETPPEWLASIDPGVTYEWQVVALDAEDRTAAVSPPTTFVVGLDAGPRPEWRPAAQEVNP